MENNQKPYVPERPLSQDGYVHMPGFTVNTANGNIFYEDQRTVLPDAQAAMLIQLVSYPNGIVYPKDVGDISPIVFKQRTVKLRNLLPVDHEYAKKLIGSFNGGLRLNYPELQRQSEGRLAHPDFAFYTNGFVEAGDKWQSLTPLEFTVLDILEASVNIPIRRVVFERMLRERGYEEGNIGTTVSRINKLIVSGRKNVAKPIVSENGTIVLLDPTQPTPKPRNENKLPIRIVKSVKRATKDNPEVVLDKIDEEHAHKWLIDEPNGEQSEAMCKHCGITRLFSNEPVFLGHEDREF